ncbi:MAG: 6-phosphogluconolactonase [Patescibacteria group bacterium]
MIRDCGLVNVESILQHGKSLFETGELYDAKVRKLFLKYAHKVAVMGIGVDGHTAGIPAKSQKIKVKSQKYDLVMNVNNFPGEFGQRITLTFRALEQMDLFIVLVFGSEKQSALNAMFRKGSEEEIPARFFLRPEIAKKTLLITDQNV